MDLAIIIPALNEREALPELISEIEAAVDPLGLEWQVLVVDDGSTDGTFEMLEGLAAANDRLGAIRLRRNFGKSAALAVGFDSTNTDVVVTIDGDGQDDPANIPGLLEQLDSGFDLVSGWKRDRQDPASRRWASKLFNWLTARFTGVAMHDMNCGFKAYRGQCARSIEVYGEMHRFMPVLASQQGWTVTELPVNHRQRQHGRSRFGLERYARGGLDLITVVFLGRYQYRPLHLFGGLGAIVTMFGLLIGIYLTVLRLSGETIGQRPLLFLGVLLIMVGVQLLTFGLLGQMLVLARREIGGNSLELSRIDRVLGPGGTDLTPGTDPDRSGQSAGQKTDSSAGKL